MSQREDGFLMIEVIVGAFCLALIVGAVATLFVMGNRNSLAGQRQAALIAVADQQIEKIRTEVKTQGFGALAMSSAPSAASTATLSSDANVQLDPNYFAPSSPGCGASNQGFAIETNYDNTSEGASTTTPTWSGCTNASFSVIEPLEILSGGFVSPQQTNVTVGTETATVDTYVTDTFVGCTSSLGGCPTITSTSGGSTVSGCTFPTTTASSTTCADARRVIVAVVPSPSAHQNAAQNSPVYISTVFTNPTPSNAPTSAIGINLGASIG